MTNELNASRIPSGKMIARLLKELEREKNAALATGNNFNFVVDYYLMHLGLNLGLRISEMSRLTWGDINAEHVEVRQGKGGLSRADKTAPPRRMKSAKPRTVEFGPATAGLLAAFKAAQIKQGYPCLPGDGLFIGARGQMTRYGLHERFTYWKNRMGLPKAITFHSLRHYYATYLLENGVSLALIKAQLGHSSIAITSVYLHHTTSAVDKLKNIN